MPSLFPTSLIAVAIAHIIAITFAIALIAVVAMALVAVTIALFVSHHTTAMALAALAPSRPSSLAGCCVPSPHATASHLLAPLRIVTSRHAMASRASCMAGCCVASPICQARLGIPIFGSSFWDPHRRRTSDSVYDTKDSGRIFF